MLDRYATHTASFGAPAGHGFPIAPNDATDLEEVTRGLFVGTAGNVAVTMRLGGSVTFKNIPAGSLLPIRATRVLATGTTAGDIIGLS